MEFGLTLAIAVARITHNASTILLVGAIVFHVLLFPVPLRRPMAPVLGVIMVSGLAWLILQAAALSDAGAWREAIAAVPVVALHTRFGQMLLVHMALLLGAGLLARRQGASVAALVLALAGVILPVATSHAAAMQDGWLVLTLAVHIVSATAWLGGLLPLWAVTGNAGLSLAQRQGVVRRFSHLGLIAVLLLAGTGGYQAWQMTADAAGLFGTTYGWLLLGKSFLFLALLSLAALNRFVFSPVPARGGGMVGLRRSIVAETGIGLLVIAAAVLLASTAPAIHEEPVWPFPLRIVGWEWGAALSADQAREIGFYLALGGLVLLAGWRSLRMRLVMLGLLLGLSGYAASELQITVAHATPTSFQTMPQGFSSESIIRGATLFAASPAEGLQALLRAPPQQATEGDFYGHVTNIAGSLLTETQRWDVAAYLFTASAGAEMQRDAGWSQPIKAPDMPLLCKETGETTLVSLRGKVLRIASGFAPPVAGAVTINLDPDRVAGSDCVAASAEPRRAYALLAGVPEARMTGLWLLVDGNGWLRGSGLGTMPDILEEAVSAITALPLPQNRAHH